MFPADAYVIRPATEQDASTLRMLAALDETRPLTGRVLIGEIAGRPAAAVSLKTGAVISDPFTRTDGLRMHLRMRASAVNAVTREPSLRERMLDALRTRAPLASLG